MPLAQVPNCIYPEFEPNPNRSHCGQSIVTAGNSPIQRLHVMLTGLLAAASQRQMTAELSNGTILIERRGHLRGLWRFADAQFEWIPAGYNEPTFTTPSVEEAAAYTRASILK